MIKKKPIEILLIVSPRPVFSMQLLFRSFTFEDNQPEAITAASNYCSLLHHPREVSTESQMRQYAIQVVPSPCAESSRNPLILAYNGLLTNIEDQASIFDVCDGGKFIAKYFLRLFL